jgi:hypothetical protein
VRRSVERPEPDSVGRLARLLAAEMRLLDLAVVGEQGYLGEGTEVVGGVGRRISRGTEHELQAESLFQLRRRSWSRRRNGLPREALACVLTRGWPAPKRPCGEVRDNIEIT